MMHAVYDKDVPFCPQKYTTRYTFSLNIKVRTITIFRTSFMMHAVYDVPFCPQI